MDAAPPPTIWILTDGKAGDEQPLIGLAEQMAGLIEPRRVRPRPPFVWFMPWGPIDPRERPLRPGSPLSPPFPDICLATGRRAVAYLRTLKAASPATYTVFFRDPRTLHHGADLLVVQAHDAPRGPGIRVVVTAPNRISTSALDEARRDAPTRLRALPSPRSAVLVGGNSRHHAFTADDVDRLVDGLRRKVINSGGLMITTSRRTPDALKQALAMLAELPNVDLWDGSGPNPLLAYLALADDIVVTADSTNMIGEAAATGKPIQIFHPSGGHRKIDGFIDALAQAASIGSFPDAPASGDYPPVRSTPETAKAIVEGWRARRQTE